MAAKGNGAPSRTPLMAGNWKMNLDHFEAAHLVQKLAWTLDDAKHDFDAVEVALLPPFTDLRSVQTLVDGDKLGFRYGAQDVSRFDKGAYTGEISGAMLAKLRCTYVVVGHSERRQYHHEDDALVNAKAKAAIKHDLVPIVCIGEGLEVRKEGRQVQHCLAQLDADLAGIPAEKAGTLVIAYEPVWAIGTGLTPTAADVAEMHARIRSDLAALVGDEAAAGMRVLYGGSVKPANARELLSVPNVDGALVGGASLVAGDFLAIAGAYLTD